MAGDVRVTLGANLEVTTSGVDDAKRKAAEVQSATDGVRDSATAAGDAVTEAMQDAANATRETAEAMRQAAQAAANAARASTRDLPLIGDHEIPMPRPAIPLIGDTDLTDARAGTIRRETASASILARTGNNPEALAARAQQGLVGVEASLAGGVSTPARQAQLEERLKRAEYYAGQAKDGLAPEKMDALAEHLDAVREALEKNRGAIEQNTNSGGAGGLAPTEPNNPVMDTLVGELRRVAGAGLGGMGALGRVAGAAGPAGLAIGGVAGGFMLLRGLLTSLNADARNEVGGLVDIGRQYDTGENPLRWFRNTPDQNPGLTPGVTNDDILSLGYNASDAAQFLSRLDLPTDGGGVSTGLADTKTGLQFARATGISENAVADMLRTLGLGGAERGQGDRQLSIIRDAMRDGVREGVSSADTFRNMEAALTGIFQRGTNLTEAGIAFQAGLLTAGAETGNRQWQGAQGAANLGRYQDAITGGDDLAMQLALTNRTGGFTADDLGLTGAQATRYENVRSRDQITAMRLAFDLAKNNPEVMRRLAVALKAVLGGDVVLLAHYLRGFGLEGDALLELLDDDPDALIHAAANEAAESVANASGTRATADLHAPTGGVTVGDIARQTYVTEAIDRESKALLSVGTTSRFGGFEAFLRSAIPLGRASIADWLTNDDIFSPYDGSITPGAAGGPALPGAFGRPDPTARDAVRAMVSGVETDPNLHWLDIGNLSHQGAFGPTQIMAANLHGSGGWDQANLTASESGEARALGLDPNDLIPDHLIDPSRAGRRQSGENIREWVMNLTPEQQEFIRGTLVRISERKITEYMRRAAANGADPQEAFRLGSTAWYAGENAVDSEGRSVFTPGFDRDYYEGNDFGEPGAGGYTDRIYEHLNIDPDEDGGSLGRDSTLTIKFEGLDNIRVEGATASQNDRVRDAAQLFVEAIVGPQSFRGA